MFTFLQIKDKISKENTNQNLIKPLLKIEGNYVKYHHMENSVKQMAQFLPTTKGKKRRKRSDTHRFTELKYILNKCNVQTEKNTHQTS